MLGYKDIPSASNGLEGFEMAEKTHYDVILMDLQMPIMDGYTALERIMDSPLTGQPCVVALTANADMVGGSITWRAHTDSIRQLRIDAKKQDSLPIYQSPSISRNSRRRSNRLISTDIGKRPRRIRTRVRKKSHPKSQHLSIVVKASKKKM